MMHGVVGQAQLARQAGSGFTLTNPAQQQNHLRRSQVLVRKQRARIHGVNRLACATAMHRHMTTGGLPKRTGLLHTGATPWTAQPARMKVLPQPGLAERVVAYVENWKVHARRVLPCPIVVNLPAISLGMSQNLCYNTHPMGRWVKQLHPIERRTSFVSRTQRRAARCVSHPAGRDRHHARGDPDAQHISSRTHRAHRTTKADRPMRSVAEVGLC